MEAYVQKKASKNATMLGRSQARTSNFSRSGAPNSALLSSMNLDNAPNPESDIKSAILSRFSFSSETTADEMPASTAARPIRIPSSIQEKAEQIYQAPLDGVKAFEDEGLRESGFSGYAHGPEIHIDRNLEPQKRESVILHEIGHVIQRGSGMANGSGFLDSPKLEGLADSGFIASQSFTMPSAVSGPVMGCRRTQLRQPVKIVRPWQTTQPTRIRQHVSGTQPRIQPRQTTQPTRQSIPQPTFVSSNDGIVGSIYFGPDVKNSSFLGSEPLEDAEPGGRLRLLHPYGPAFEQYPHVRRYDRDPAGKKALYEKMITNDGRDAQHISRGERSDVPEGLDSESFQALCQAVKDAQQICAKEQDNFDKAEEAYEIAENALLSAALQANRQLYAFMKNHPKLKDIQLDEISAGGRELLEGRAHYR